jgi:hypothetical protein
MLASLTKENKARACRLYAVCDKRSPLDYTENPLSYEKEANELFMSNKSQSEKAEKILLTTGQAEKRIEARQHAYSDQIHEVDQHLWGEIWIPLCRLKPHKLQRPLNEDHAHKLAQNFQPNMLTDRIKVVPEMPEKDDKIGHEKLQQLQKMLEENSKSLVLPDGINFLIIDGNHRIYVATQLMSRHGANEMEKIPKLDEWKAQVFSAGIYLHFEG